MLRQLWYMEWRCRYCSLHHSEREAEDGEAWSIVCLITRLAKVSKRADQSLHRPLETGLYGEVAFHAQADILQAETNPSTDPHHDQEALLSVPSKCLRSPTRSSHSASLVVLRSEMAGCLRRMWRRVRGMVRRALLEGIYWNLTHGT